MYTFPSSNCFYRFFSYSLLFFLTNNFLKFFVNLKTVWPSFGLGIFHLSSYLFEFLLCFFFQFYLRRFLLPPEFRTLLLLICSDYSCQYSTKFCTYNTLFISSARPFCCVFFRIFDKPSRLLAGYQSDEMCWTSDLLLTSYFIPSCLL